MNKAEILKKAIEKAEKNGFQLSFSKRELIYKKWLGEKVPTEALYGIIFDHWFAKAFFGEEPEVCKGCRRPHPEGIADCDTEVMGRKYKRWQYFLQEMVLAKEPLEYLYCFLNIKDDKTI